ncbi:MAG: hypothetical protein AAF317_08900, partial [Pseudomonadota bacterium]
LGNDTDADADELSVTAVGTATNGEAVINEDEDRGIFRPDRHGVEPPYDTGMACRFGRRIAGLRGGQQAWRMPCHRFRYG